MNNNNNNNSNNTANFMNLLITAYYIRLENNEITPEQYEVAINNICEYYCNEYVGYVN